MAYVSDQRLQATALCTAASWPTVATTDAIGRFHLKTQICGFCGKTTSEPVLPPCNTFLQPRSRKGRRP